MRFVMDLDENKITVYDIKKNNIYLKYSIHIYGNNELLYSNENGYNNILKDRTYLAFCGD